jgi:hypothetical protein
MLSADTGKFVKGLGEARGKIEEFGMAAASVAAGVAAGDMGVSAVQNVISFFIDLAESAVNTVVNLAKLSRALNDTTEGIAALQYAQKSLGGDAGAVNDGLLTLAQTTDAAARGNVYANKTFDQLGLSAKEMAKLTPTEQFKSLSDKIAGIHDPTQRAAAAFRIFGEQNKALLPVLNKGAEGLAKSAEEAKKLGQLPSALNAEKIEQAAVTFDKVKMALEGIGIQILERIAPAVMALSENFDELASKVDLGEKIADAFEYGAKAIAYMLDLMVGLKMTMKTMEGGFIDMFQTFNDVMQKIIAQGAKLPGSVGQSFRDLQAESNAAADASENKLKELKQEILELANSGSHVDAVTDFMNKLRKATDEAAKALRNAKSAGGALNKAVIQNPLFGRGKEIEKQMATPLEKFSENLGELNALLQANAVGFDTYARAVTDAAQKLQTAHQMMDTRLPGAVQAGTSEAYSAVVKSSMESDMKLRESPQERVARIMAESKEIEKQQLQVQREIAKALQAQKGADIN